MSTQNASPSLASSVFSRRRFLSSTAKTVAAAAAAPYIVRTQAFGASTASKKSGKRPNLVFVFTDQQSWDMLGCNGNSQILTPHLDTFARTAVNFDHCVSNCPVCTPARGILLSGQHPLYSGTILNDTKLINGIPTMGSVLEAEGYNTGYIGKWHLLGGPRPRPVPPGPDRHGFETFLSNNATLDFRPGHAFFYNDAGEKVIFNEWEAYGQTRQAVNFIDRQSKDQPFALYLSMHPPHDQGLAPNALRYQSIPELMQRYHRDDIRMRPSVGLPDDPTGDGTAKFGGEEGFWNQVRDDYHGYYAMTSGCDDCFGQVIEALERNGLDENTIVVFTSDHGDLLFSHGRPWPKSFPEDASCRVPLLIRNPGSTPENTRTDLVFGFMDMMPTLLGMMGIEAPDTCQGSDFSQPIRNGDGSASEEQPLFYFVPGWRGIYTKRHTYAWDKFDGKEWQSWNVLYDRVADPFQLTNFYDSPNPAMQAIRNDLHARSEKWLARYDDEFLGGYELLRRLGRDSPHFDKPGDEGTFGGRPIDLIRS